MNSHTQSVHKASICFVSLENYATLVGDQKYGRIGGAEIQQAIIGRELARRGYRVSFIVLDHGQDDELEIDGMQIIKAYKPDAGIRILRFVHPRLTSLWHAMEQANSYIYYQRTRDSITGVVAAFCRNHRRKFVFAVASNYDCVADPPDFTRHERILYRYGLRKADLVIAQTRTQQKLLRENFGIDSTVIPNCAPDYMNSSGRTDKAAPVRDKRILWVGRFAPIKRLEMLLDVAEHLPAFQFDVVGDGDNQSEYVQRLRSRAKAITNVHLHGAVPHESVHEFYQRSATLICTSQAEGFPNTFLEAWSCGLPVVSTFDPDNVIEDNGLGKVGHNVPELAAGIRELLDSQEQWQLTSRAARKYYLQNHTVDAVIRQFKQVFCDIDRSAGDNSSGDNV